MLFILSYLYRVIIIIGQHRGVVDPVGLIITAINPTAEKLSVHRQIHSNNVKLLKVVWLGKRSLCLLPAYRFWATESFFRHRITLSSVMDVKSLSEYSEIERRFSVALMGISMVVLYLTRFNKHWLIELPPETWTQWFTLNQLFWWRKRRSRFKNEKVND